MRSLILVSFAMVGTSSILFGQGAFIPREPSGETYGSQWTYLKNEGQCFDLGGTFRSDIEAQSVGTTPTVSVLRRQRTSMCFPFFFEQNPSLDHTLRLDWTFIGGNSTVIEYYDPVGAHWNFYEEFTPQGILDVHGAKRILQLNIYDYIDYHVLSNAHGPKFQIVIRPGGDPDDIRIMVQGHDSLKVDVDGMLKMYSGQAFVKLQQCFAYQQDGTTIVNVPWMATYTNVPGSSLVKLSLGSYDDTLPLILVIVPWQPESLGGGGGGGSLPEWGTYVNGSGHDGILALAHDNDGYVYLTGNSRSNAGFPIFPGDAQNTFGGLSDAIYGRCNANYEFEGEDTWMTYLGGAGLDFGTSIAYDGPRNRIGMCGQMGTNSAFLNVPLSSNPNCYQHVDGHCYVAYADASNGVIEYLTQYQDYLEVYATGVDFDNDGNMYVAGYGQPEGFELTDPPGTTDYYFDDFDPPSFTYDGFIARFTPQADHTWETVLGGPQDEYVYGVHVDRTHNRIYVYGNTESMNDANVVDGSPGSAEFEYPLTNGGGWFQYQPHGPFTGYDQEDCFIMQFDLSSLAMLWSTRVGGNGGMEAITDVATDDAGNIFATGFTNSSFYNQAPCGWTLNQYGFPGCHSGTAYFQPAYMGNSDNFMLKFDPSTTLVWATFVGNAGIEEEYPTTRHNYPKVDIDDDQNAVLFANTGSGAIADQFAPITMVPNGGYYYQLVHGDAPVSIANNMDTYVAVFTNDGTHQNSTFYGGIGNDWAGGLVAFNGRLYLSGTTFSAVNFPLNCPPLQSPIDPYCNQTPLCSAASTDAFMAQLRTSIPIGINDHVAQSSGSLVLAPNPATGVVRVIATQDMQGKRLIVLDALGKLVHEEPSLRGYSIAMDLGHLSSGVYFVGFLGTTEYVRLVKE